LKSRTPASESRPNGCRTSSNRSSPTRNRGDAIGLGLTTARQVVADAGGAIDVASEPGCGTTFRVTVPVID
jgi:signal transduction histidine kinase